ncbi:HK97-gp10 family putative phage morphogenesis protein [Xanthobacter sp. TB0139]|uniref:HK97-gp10 family putative phage morphogenesis protein n=1 Tax=Xanthobacter sp. TB0139 TaxID=3459178 RepID=UPI00403A5474
MKAKIKLEGLYEAGQGLEDLSKATQRGVLNRALKKAAKPLVDAANANAPEREGHRPPGHRKLKGSIEAIVLRGNAGKAAYAKAMRAGATKKEAGQAARAANRAAAGRGATATVRVRTTVPHAHLQEDGTVRHAAQPFMSPAFHTTKGITQAAVIADLKSEITKAAARAAKRALRKGGKK